MIFSTLYIIAVSTMCVLTERYAPIPELDRFNSEDGTRGFFYAFLGMASFAGWVLPHELHQSFGWDFGSNWLSRAAQIVGAVGGWYVAARGLLVWLTIIVCGLMIIALGKVGAFIFG
jgi:hypothetical protein